MHPKTILEHFTFQSFHTRANLLKLSSFHQAASQRSKQKTPPGLNFSLFCLVKSARNGPPGQIMRQYWIFRCASIFWFQVVRESVSDVFSFKYSVNQVIQVIKVIHVIQWYKDYQDNQGNQDNHRIHDNHDNHDNQDNQGNQGYVKIFAHCWEQLHSDLSYIFITWLIWMCWESPQNILQDHRKFLFGFPNRTPEWLKEQTNSKFGADFTFNFIDFGK